MPERDAVKPGKWARLRPWILPILVFGVAWAVVLVLWGTLRRDVWAYYTDGAELHAEVDDDKVRPVLWQDPEPHRFAERDGAETGTLEAAFSADGTMMVLVHWGKGGDNADLYRSDWNGRVWSKPEPIKSVNTKAAERSPALSRDGRYLYFASDRKGGVGGDDLYMARWDGVEWQAVERLPRKVNTEANERGPALSADDGRLYFSSDRKGGADDIFVAEIRMPEAKDPPDGAKQNRQEDRKRRRKAADQGKEGTRRASPLAPVPGFGFAAPVSELNSDAADVQAALTTRGGHVFLASNRDGRGGSGFKIYLSRVVGGETLPPEEVDLYIEHGDVTDPAVRMEGFDLLFSVGTQSGDGAAYGLFRSTTREVVGYTDMSRWEQFKELMDNIKWWILLAIAALIALIYILERWRDMTSLFHKCLAGSAVVHLLALLLAMVMLIATKIEEDESRDDSVVEVSIDALAQEELALESIPEEANLTDTTANLETEKEESEFGAPGFESPDEAQPLPESAQSTKESVLVEAAPAMSDATEEPVTESTEEASVLSDLAVAALPEIEPAELEERDPGEAQPVDDATAEQFEPAESVVRTDKVDPEMAEDSAVETPPDATEVAENQPVEPLVDQPKEPEIVESTTSESAPAEVDVAAETPPLESEMLTGLPDAQFVDPNETAFEEVNPASDQGGPADPSEELFDPGQAVASVASEPAMRGGTASDTAADRPAGAAEVAESAPDAGSAVGGTVSPEIAESGVGDNLPASDLAPALPDAALVDPGLPMLEEPATDVAGGPANETSEQFEPGRAAAEVATAPVEAGTVADAAVSAGSDAAAVPEGGRVAESAAVDTPAVAQAPSGEDGPETPALDQGDLPETSLVDLEIPTLEEGGGASRGVADPAQDHFEPSAGSVPNLSTSPEQGTVDSGSAVESASDVAKVQTEGMVADSALSEVRRSEATASDGGSRPAPARPGMLPDLAIAGPGMPTLEEPQPGAGGGAADISKDMFQPGGGVSGITTNRAGGGALADVAVERAAASGAVGRSDHAPGGQVPIPHGDLLADGMLPDLGGGGVTADLASPGQLPSPSLPGALDVPPGLGSRGMADVIRKQRGKPGLDTIEQMGGSKGSEEAVGAAMEWLSKNQEADGCWDTVKHGAKQDFDTGGTGLALLCFYGWGERHDVDCRYRTNVKGAIDWLVAQQRKNGYLGGGPGMMYSHAISAIALCEAYGVTKDPELRQPAERAIAYTLSSQHPTLGGWRYTPGNGADTSVTGWQYMALHSARMAGLEVPEEAFDKARGFLAKTGGGKHGGLYGYQARADVSRAMVATGMFCRQLDLVPPSDPKMVESARFLKMHPMKTTKPDLYYVYYATLALYQHQGPVWMAWNERLQETLKVLQKKHGATAGSWDPSSSMTADGGRVISTCLATLSLEVYYRLLPMYGFRNTETEAPDPKVRGEGE